LVMLFGVPIVWRNNSLEGSELGVGVVKVMLGLAVKCDGVR
jgi:hypothetical protein